MLIAIRQGAASCLGNIGRKPMRIDVQDGRMRAFLYESEK
ncbi:hypothetical protein CAter282_2683 [Collimonas arenae]|uniref:Uncharacterized protein n=1 Tax=Collimonas arenae TaxID=279058 RepID=A0A127PT27_9BURK|nr:hypothetical protein CAter10_2956 [Collimonas arenae]AMP10413.1 hypothetical protein CAter282_2683 [Collimonas arenae]